jgi:hypothetical protein
VQMTRYYMLEARRCGIQLSPRRAGFRSDAVLRFAGRKSSRSAV